jgi:class III lanthionine synthetase
VNKQYEAFCVADPLFYDSLASQHVPIAQFAAASRPVPAGWQREPLDDWLMYAPVGTALRSQGWKIHISARMDNAERVLDLVYGYCVPRGLPFKFIRGPRALLMRNSKYAPRRASGKFITIYPDDDAQLELACKELGGLLDGEPGPYILSDLRIGRGPLYVRYGAFAERYCLSGGRIVPAIADQDGTLVPDLRGPVFAVPTWVTAPEFLADDLRARNEVTTKGLPYRIEDVIHFSNGGGLYVATDTRTGQRVVLKEARPHAGLDGTGADAVARLHRERRVLVHLAGIPRVPRLHDEFQLGEHHFLAIGFVDGQSLNRLQVERYPLIGPAADPAECRRYATWALRLYRQVEEVVGAIHERGMSYGDLHMRNILVGPDDTVTLIDFEVAVPIAHSRARGMGDQAFSAPADRIGRDVDRYALACLRLALFLPLTAVLRLVPGKAAQFADVISEWFDVPRQFLDEAVEIIDRAGPPADRAAQARQPDVAPPTFEPAAAGWPATRAQLAGAIVASATPDREDRLFPGDIEQFDIGGGLNLAHGAAGVLYGLWATGAGRHPEYEEWLVRRARQPRSGARCGFYDGMHGMAYVLELLGHRDEALDVLDICLREKWQQLGLDLRGGLSGIALNLLHLADRTGDPTLRSAAWRAVDLVSDRLGTADSVPEVSGDDHPYAGLLRGSSGPALLFLRTYERTREASLLDLAATAIRQDLRRCVPRADGQLQVNEGWRTMPYLAQGSVGIGIVLDQYLAHRPDERFVQASAAILRAATAPFYAQSGLFAGRAGIILYLAHRARRDPWVAPELAAQVRYLGWHALPYRDHVAFPGEQLLRLSMDLATGTAGVLLALGAAVDDVPVDLPFLTPTPAPQTKDFPPPAGRG